jgi:DNA-binding NtrC family response regulator
MSNVLVASADGELRKICAVELAQAGEQSLLSADAIEAMQLVNGGEIRAAIIDMDLPAPGGEALFERIRSEEVFSHLPIMLVLREGEDEDFPETQESDLEIVSRPITRKILSHSLYSLLSDSDRTAQAPQDVDANQEQDRSDADTGATVTAGAAMQVRRLCHDLNNPLAVIMGQLELISDRHLNLDQDLVRRHGEINTAAEAMQQIIREASKEARKVTGAENS